MSLKVGEAYMWKFRTLLAHRGGFLYITRHTKVNTSEGRCVTLGTYLLHSIYLLYHQCPETSSLNGRIASCSLRPLYLRHSNVVKENKIARSCLWLNYLWLWLSSSLGQIFHVLHFSSGGNSQSLPCYLCIRLVTVPQ